MHAESMLDELGLGGKIRGRKDLRGRRVIFVDDEANEYRTMCFTIAAKLVRKRGADVEILKPKPGETPQVRVEGNSPQPVARRQSPVRRNRSS